MIRRCAIGAYVSILILCPAGVARGLDDGVVEKPNVRVEYRGIDKSYAEAVARLTEAALAVYRDEFGFDMPDRVQVSVECARGNPVRLWTDGQDAVTLTLDSERKLRKPSSSGVFNVYGFCHELGHMAMYRTLKKRAWLADGAAEGWAHYCGSVVVDRVFAAEGEDLWPDRYDYRADGTQRLKEQLASKSPSDVAKAAGLWQELAELIGEKNVPGLFAAWNAADADASNPTPALRKAFLDRVEPVARGRAEKRFDAFAKRCVVRVARSAEPYRTANRKQLAGEPVLLKHDDARSDGQRSIAGSGHAVFFDAPQGDWYVVRMHLYGSRYGLPRPPDEDVTVTLCDAELKPIRTWDVPYARFQRGDPRWHRIDLEPTSVPPRFAICVDFAPTRNKGVYVHMDSSSGGHSATGLPGRPYRPLDGGDWMIRVELDGLKIADPLRP